MTTSIKIGRRGSARGRSGALLGALSVLTLSLGACAESESGGSGGGPGAKGGGEGLPATATKEEFIEALADMDPVTVKVPVVAGKGAPTNEAAEIYKTTVEEWSGGKITVEIGYGGSIVTIDQVEAALSDGRAQLGAHVPQYQPDEFPAHNAIADLGFIAEPSPLVGRLQAYAAMQEVAWGTPEAISEMEDVGLVPIQPITVGGSPQSGLLCREDSPTSLADLEGLKARAAGRALVGPMDTLGITPVSLAAPEVYEGLQRGIVDCAALPLTTAKLLGLVDLASSYSLSADVGLPIGPGATSFSKDFFEDLPLAAQQLLWDRMDVYFEQGVRYSLQQEVESVTALRDVGAEMVTWDAEVSGALQAYYDGVLAESRETLEGIEDPGGLVDRLIAAHEKWYDIVTEEFGLEDGGEYADFPEWYDESQVDFEGYIDKIMSTILEEHRPS